MSGTGTVLRGPGPVPSVPGLPGAGESGAGLSGGRLLDFKRSSSPTRRRRPNPLLVLLRPLSAALLLVALPGGLAAWVLTSPFFQLREVVVAGGTRRVPADWVAGTLAPLEGKNLVLLPLGDVASQLRRNPWIETVELRKELPGLLRVAVSERRPVALLFSEGRLVYADTAGRPIMPVGSADEARQAGLLEVRFSHPMSGRVGGVAGALAVAAELGRVRADWAGALVRIEVLGEEDFRLHTRALPFPLLVTLGQVGPKIRRLEELLPELQRRYSAIAAVDLRFSRRIVIQPTAPGAAGGQGSLSESDLQITG
jgi:cell division septal protein FtsQ